MREEREVLSLSWLARMPLLTADELAAVLGLSRATAYRALKDLKKRDLASSIGVSAGSEGRVRRWFITARGLRYLTHAHPEGRGDMRPLPASRGALRRLLARLEAVAVIYALTAEVARRAGLKDFAWSPGGALDAGLVLEGACIGIFRQGPFLSRAQASRRLKALRRGPVPGLLLGLAPDPVQARELLSSLSRLPCPSFVAVEGEVLDRGPGERLWQGPRDAGPLTLAEALGQARGGALPGPPKMDRGRPPSGHLARDLLRDDLSLLARLTPAQRALLDTVALWPLITRRDLALFLDLAEETVRVETQRLLRAGLLVRTGLGSEACFALSDPALRALARRDRASPSRVLGLWSARRDAAGTVRGARLREMLRSGDHTAAAARFCALLVQGARQAGLSARVLPGHRLVLHFQGRARVRQLQPDAWARVFGPGPERHFLLEWEHRATGPSRHRRKLAPYLAFYASGAPLDYFGTWPVLLVVLPDEAREAGFLRALGSLAGECPPDLRVLTTTADLALGEGPCAPVWRREPGGPRAPLWQ